MCVWGGGGEERSNTRAQDQGISGVCEVRGVDIITCIVRIAVVGSLHSPIPISFTAATLSGLG